MRLRTSTTIKATSALHPVRKLLERHLVFPDGSTAVIGYWFVRYNDTGKGIDVTVGNFYDQFGNGLVLRLRIEGFGIDNALDGFDSF